MIALVTAICLNLSPCTLEEAWVRSYIVFHDDVYQDADMCDLVEVLGPTKDAKAALDILSLAPQLRGKTVTLFYKCLRNFVPARGRDQGPGLLSVGDKETPNPIEMAPALIPQIRRKIQEDPGIILRLQKE